MRTVSLSGADAVGVARAPGASDTNRARHQSLDGNAPEPREVQDRDGSVYAIPHLGGLHHEYRRAG